MAQNLYYIVVIPILIVIAILYQWNIPLIAVLFYAFIAVIFIAIFLFYIARLLFYRLLIRLLVIEKNIESQHVFEILTIIFVVLKLCDAIYWSWWSVLTPFFVFLILKFLATIFSLENLCKRYLDMTLPKQKEQKKQEDTEVQQEYYAIMEELVVKLCQGEEIEESSSEVIIEAKETFARIEKYGYEYISCRDLLVWFSFNEINSELESSDLKVLEYSLIDVSMSGYFIAESNFFEIPNANKEVNEILVDNSKSGTKDEANFIKTLGNNQEKKIVFYDIGNKELLLYDQDHDEYYIGSQADVACLWARKLGYKNVFKLAGGLKAWIRYGYPIQP